jgi:hypothetical protein
MMTRRQRRTAPLLARGENGELGPNPLLLMRGAFLRLLLLGLIVMVLIAVTALLFPSTGLNILAVILGAIWIYLLIDVTSDLIGARGGIGMFAASVRQVRRGAINPTLVIRADSCDGMIVVDEIARLVMINAIIWPMDSVTGVQQRDDMIDVMLSDTVTPVVGISLDSANDARDAILRLSAALGTAEITNL